jgi:hypothetical protein
MPHHIRAEGKKTDLRPVFDVSRYAEFIEIGVAARQTAAPY